MNDLLPIPSEPAPGTIWRHFKGGVYKVIQVVRDCENPDNFFVVYERTLGEGWIREHSNFMGIHDNGHKRFTQL